MNKILALETANDHCSVALVDAEQTLFFTINTELRQQTQQILPMIEQALQQTQTPWQQISAIAFSRGPGSFNGVRVNTAVAQALAWAHDIPVVPVSSLQALAQHAYQQQGLTESTCVLDAHMQEVYFAQYRIEQGLAILQGEEQLLSYAQAQTQQQFALVGTGAKLLESNYQTDTHKDYADARDIATIARFLLAQGCSVSAEHALPIYLRDNAWKKIAEQKSLIY